MNSGKAEKKNGKKKSGGGEDDSADTKRDKKLQAILLADAFTKTFRPITLTKPKVMLPLVNVPMLDYTIEFLAQNGVEEIFVFCVWHAAMLEDYIAKSKWPSTISVRCIHSGSCASVGDALREIDKLAIINSDPFILITGDVISNMDLKKAISAHKERRKLDNDAIMTIVLKKVQTTSGINPILQDLVVAMDSESNQILYFDDSISKKAASVPIQIMRNPDSEFRSHLSVQFRSDLLDCHIDICSPELLLQFADNFDYHDIRKQFIHNEVVNWELGMHIFGYVLQNEYAARVHEPRSYHAVCQDIINRWVSPLVPDSVLLPDSSCTHIGRYVYKENNVRISRSAKIGPGVVIGRGAIIEDFVEISDSVVGRDCKIRANAIVKDSHIWARAEIQESSEVHSSILCEDVVVKRSAKVPRGCILSQGVIVGESVTLLEYTRLSIHPNREDSCTKLASSQDYDLSVVGPDGKGFVYTLDSIADSTIDEDDGYEGDRNEDQIDSLIAASIGCSEEERWKKNLWSSMPELDNSESDGSELFDEIEADSFHQLVEDVVYTGRRQGDTADNIVMEIKSLKFSYNKDFSDCVAGIVPPILKLVLDNENCSSVVRIMTAMKGILAKDCWGFILIKPFLQEVCDEVALVETLESVVLLENSLLYGVFRLILQLMYDSELISDEALQEWIAYRREEDDPSSKTRQLFLEPQVQMFVEWLEEEESGEDEDDEEED